MGNELIINVTSQETRVALLENGQVVEFHLEPLRDRGIVGNIYKGRVIRVLPGMQAAFVDIGMDRAAFLYVDDIRSPKRVLDDHADSSSIAEIEVESEEVNGSSGIPEDVETAMAPPPSENGSSIDDIINEGQILMVQVAKEPLGTKGARITSHISLPGRHLVLMPSVDHIGISRRIESEAERKRLKELVESVDRKGMGFIVRTAAEGKEEEAIRADAEIQMNLWSDILEKYEKASPPVLVHSDLNISLRAIRDLFNADVERVVIDSKEEYDRILSYFGKHMPKLNTTIELYEGEEPIFDHFGLEIEISRALQRKVWLKSGGYIVIEQTEALTAIDVNTGRYVGKRNLEDTILKTNLEAVREICYQLRLRNIGGIIIIDFIDMEKESNRDKVFGTLTETLKTDKAKTNILKISELGLVEMTRKRTRENISRLLSEACPYCEGKGYVKSRSSICSEIFRELQREAVDIKGKSVLVSAHPDIADMLYEEARGGIEEIEKKYRKRITVKENAAFHIEQFEIIGS